MTRENRRKIEFFLYNYEKLDYMVKLVEDEYIDSCCSLGVASYLKGITCKAKTLENQIIKMDEDKRIRKYRSWQVFIKKILDFFGSKKPLDYDYLVLKYFDKHTEKEIESVLKIDVIRQKEIKKEIIEYIYETALIEKLL